MLKQFFRCGFITAIVFLLVCSKLNAQEKTALVGKDIVVFYPDNYQSSLQQPSLALIKELEEIGSIPDDWKIKVSFDSINGKNIAHIEAGEETSLYGTGEVTGSLLRNGTVRELWNSDNYTYKKFNALRLYQSHPWVLGVREDGTAFGALSDNTYKQSIALGNDITFVSEGPASRIIVIERNTPEEVMQALVNLTGKMPMPPLWSLGYQQCRWSYYPDTRVKEIADTFRLKKIPCDVIWMDIHYMDGYRIFTFSDEYFPKPKEVNDYLHEKGFKSIWMIDPGVKNEEGYFVYDSGTEKDVWVKDANGNNFIGEVWPGPCVFPDFTQSVTREWWSGLYKDFMATGIDGVWNDMNEPAVFKGVGWTMTENSIHFGDNTLPKAPHARYHNVYGMLMVKASREGIQQANPKKRPFVLTRSNYIGGHRYAATWTGDNTATWEHLRMSVPMVLNLGLSGQSFSGPDIGGFHGNASPDLFAHWIATGVFYPFSRAHTEQGTENQEPWAFGKEVEDVARTAIERRYRLLPYLYTLFYEASNSGMPVMRPVFFADVQDKVLRKEDQAFLLGGDLLVIPKWAENPRLPKGNWRTISLVGEDSKNDPYQPEVKLREGAILPLGKVIQNTDEYSIDTLTLFVSLDEKGMATGTLYHDKGNGYEYLKDGFLLTNFVAEKHGNKVTVSVSNTKGNMKINNQQIYVEVITDEGIFKGKGVAGSPIDVKLR